MLLQTSLVQMNSSASNSLLVSLFIKLQTQNIYEWQLKISRRNNYNVFSENISKLNPSWLKMGVQLVSQSITNIRQLKIDFNHSNESI